MQTQYSLNPFTIYITTISQTNIPTIKFTTFYGKPEMSDNTRNESQKYNEKKGLLQPIFSTTTTSFFSFFVLFTPHPHPPPLPPLPPPLPPLASPSLELPSLQPPSPLEPSSPLRSAS